MADIQQYINNIQNAVYGEEVRGSIINALNAVNSSATGSATVAETSAITSAEKASEAVTSATSAASSNAEAQEALGEINAIITDNVSEAPVSFTDTAETMEVNVKPYAYD